MLVVQLSSQFLLYWSEDNVEEENDEYEKELEDIFLSFRE